MTLSLFFFLFFVWVFICIFWNKTVFSTLRQIAALKCKKIPTLLVSLVFLRSHKSVALHRGWSRIGCCGWEIRPSCLQQRIHFPRRTFGKIKNYQLQRNISLAARRKREPKSCGVQSVLPLPGVSLRQSVVGSPTGRTCQASSASTTTLDVCWCFILKNSSCRWKLFFVF